MLHNFKLLLSSGVDILSCKEAEMKNLLNRVVSGLLKNGVHENDIAILVGKRTELDRLQSTLSDIHLNESNTSEMSQKQQNEREMSTRRYGFFFSLPELN
jgi:hypothetical protein